MLTLIQTNEASVELSDGQEPKAGQFYYKPKQLMIDGPVVNIVYIKQCKMTTEFNKKITRDKSHYLVGGVLDGTADPFIMYIKGVSYAEVWELFNQTRPWRKHKVSPVAMFAFKVRLYTEKKDTDFGKKWAVCYEMIADANGTPVIEDDIERLRMLDSAVDSCEAMVQGIITKNIDDYGMAEPSFAEPPLPEED